MISNKQRAAIIDEYGELERKIAAFKPVADRAAALKKEIASWYEHQPADEVFVAEGKLYNAQVSAKALERRVFDMPKLFSLLGRNRFLEFCKVSLAAIDQHVASEKHPAFLHSERSGNRTVKTVAISPAQKAA